MSYFAVVKISDFAGQRIVDVSEGSPRDANISELFVRMRDQETGNIDILFQAGDDAFLLAADTIIDDTTITVQSGHSIVAGQSIILRQDEFFSQFRVINVATNVITLDSPIDRTYIIAETRGGNGSTNLAVDGSITPQYFYVRPNSSSIWDITQLVFAIESADVPGGEDFGDIAGGLAIGLVLQLRSDENKNIFTIRRNIDFANYGHDLVYDKQEKLPDFNFVRARRIFGGVDHTGTVLRLCGVEVIGTQDSLRIVVQDDLSSLASLRTCVQGYVSLAKCEEE